MTFPTYQEFMKLAVEGNQLAQLLLVAMSQLSSLGKFTSYMPEEIYAELVKLSGQVYTVNSDADVLRTASKVFTAANHNVPTIDVPEVK